MTKILLTGAAMAFVLGLSSAAFAAGPPDCANSDNSTPGGFIVGLLATAVPPLEAPADAPGTTVSGGDGNGFSGAKNGGNGNDVQAGLQTCGVGSQPD